MLRPYIWSIDAGPSGPVGTPCYYTGRTNMTDSASYVQATENLSGAGSAVVTIQVTKLVNTNGSNPSAVQVNTGSGWLSVSLNSTFQVTLDASGVGSFISLIQGSAANTGTLIDVIYTIVGVSSGQIGSPNGQEESKTF